jgi:hexosaminidase
MLHLIPTPYKTTMSDERLAVAPVYTADALCADAAETLAVFARRTHGITLTEGKGGITFEADATLPAEGYTITVTSEGVAVKAADGEGAQHAAVTLIQLMETAEAGLTLPAGTLEDHPRCTYRTVMIDLARDWHELHVLYEYVDMCCFYKVRYLHLHFTDDQSYTLPSKAFPKLSTEGRHYTEEELKGLLAYAKTRGVQIIPEIDVPGHASSFCAAYGDIFGRDGIICQSEESMEAMSTLFRELCELFADSDYIHMGGDEAFIDRWTTCDKCLQAFRNAGVEVDKYLENDASRHELAEIMYATFVKRICEVILACGKTPVVWEGFHEDTNHMIPRDALIVSWENYYQTTPQLQKAGFRLVNGSWCPMYVVTPNTHWTPEDIYNWNVYTWRPVHSKSPYAGRSLTIEPTEQVEGGMLLAWGDRIMSFYPVVAEGVREEQRLIEERTLPFAENVWNREKPLTWEAFEPKMQAVAALYENFRTNK